MRSVALVTLVAAVAVTGCTPSPAPPSVPASPTLSATAAPVPLTVRRTGGIAGVDQTLTVDIDGSWVFTDERRRTREVGRLTPAQRERLQQLLASPALADEILSSRSADPGCADAFQYSLVFGQTSVSRSDCGGVEGPTLTEIVTLLAGATPL